MKPHVAAIAMYAAILSAPCANADRSRSVERDEYLLRGEEALATINVAAAIESFDRAAAMAHSADTELGLVRAYMQGGQYRRALAFGAHTAGAHRDEAGGAALYAWLLYCGGQGAIAMRVLDQAQEALPDNPLVAAVREQLQSSLPVADGALLRAPARFAPYGSFRDLPFGARVAGSGVLIDGGRHALVPIHTLKQSSSVWLRNGLGQLTAASVERWLIPSGVALLRLANPLPADPDFGVAPNDPFAGSVAFAVEYVAAPSAVPEWPRMLGGFIGGSMVRGNLRGLGVALPKGPRGGPVFDARGRFVGIAIPGDDRAEQFVPVSELRKSVGKLLGATLPATAGARLPVEQIYESAMRTAVQVIASR